MASTAATRRSTSRREELPAFFERLRERRVRRRQRHHPAQGSRVCALRQRRSAGDRTIGAVNTLVRPRRQGSTAPTPTSLGFLGNLDQNAPRLERRADRGDRPRRRRRRARRAGGAARARRRPRCTCSTARAENAEALAAEIAGPFESHGFARLRQLGAAAPASWSTPPRIGMHGTRFEDLTLGTAAEDRACHRHRLCAARHAAAGRRAGARAADRRWARHAAASGGARVRGLVRRPAGGDGGAARQGRGDTLG